MLLRQLELSELNVPCINNHQNGTKADMVVEYEAKHPITHLPDRRITAYVCEHCAEDIFNQLIEIARDLRATQTQA